MGRALYRRPEPPLHILRCCHLPSASSGDQRRTRPPALCTRSYRDRAAALQQTSPGSDAIPAEIYKPGGPQFMNYLTTLFQEMWRQGRVPQAFKDATMVNLYKQKGNRQLCDNHRGISLHKIARKVFARIVPNRLDNHLEQGPSLESQYDFHRHRGVVAARQPQNKCQEMRIRLCSTFLNLRTVVDMENPEELWKIVQKFGCPQRFTEVVHPLHDGMTARATCNGAVSEAFSVTKGVEQDCVLEPTFFSLMFSVMLMDADCDKRPGIRVAYRMDNQLLNQRRIQFQSHVSTTTVHELPFADDCALNVTSEGDMQRGMSLFAAGDYGLIISTEKTAIVDKPPLKAKRIVLRIHVNSAEMTPWTLCYLGSKLPRCIRVVGEVAHRITKAS
ncbi:hypothetical protein SprV_0200570300 [Sparganum proliferum]